LSPTPESSAVAGQFDAVVIGGGFGGLGAALTLAEQGQKVCLVERLDYLGGCAGTFTRQGLRYEAGATLAAGLAPGQLFAGWIERHRLQLALEPLDPVVELRGPGVQFAVPASRQALVELLQQRNPANSQQIKRFFELQRQIADALWAVLDDPALLPPLTPRSLGRHALRVPRYLPLLRWIGRTLGSVLAHCGVDSVADVALLCDTACQITVQCRASEAEAPIALATLDYWFRGAAHVVGGMGALAGQLGTAIEQSGGEVRLRQPAVALERCEAGWQVRLRHEILQAPRIFANLLPDALVPLLRNADDLKAPLTRLERKLDDSWTTCVLYLLLRPPKDSGDGAHHLDLTSDLSDLTMGHHVFLSVSSAADAKAPEGMRTAILSTHVPLKTWLSATPQQQALLVDQVYAQMLQTLGDQAPEWRAAVVSSLSGSPRTWQRFTGRPSGKVGGVPRRAGLHNYLDLGPCQLAPGLYLVGDTVFPGQSALATALGGQRAAIHSLG
jgi:phytoene dehydrogenase-like protein